MKIYFDLLSNHKKVFFCDENTKNEIEKICNTSNTRFIIQSFCELNILKKFPYETWKEQIKYDPEKYHTPELGIIWANKKEFVKDASILFPDNEWFCWVDAGCLRSYGWINDTTQFLSRQDWTTLSHGVYLQCIRPFIKKDFYTFPDEFIAGGVILFHREFIDIYSNLYDSTVKHYIKHDRSITMDQQIMASMVALNNPSWLNLVYEPEISNSSPNEWFFFISKL